MRLTTSPIRWAAVASGSNIGHYIIGVANTYRVLEVIGWRYAESALQFVIPVVPRVESEVSRANTRRAGESAGKLPPDWGGGKSDRGAVLELLSFFREGQVARACEWAYDRLVAVVPASRPYEPPITRAARYEHPALMRKEEFA